jgi:hypothetical protein
VKPLFFRALSPEEVVPALMGQAAQALRPFNRYLRQAIHTAKQRQVRYVLRWRRVKGQQVLRLKALDTLLRVRRPSARWRIVDWPRGKEPDPSKPLMVVSRDFTCKILGCWPHEDGLLIQPEEPLRADDQVFWCGQSCALEPLEEAPPRELVDSRGVTFRVSHCDAPDAETWVLRVEGEPAQGPLRAGGQELDARRLDALEGVQALTDTSGRVHPLSGGQLKVEEPPARGVLAASSGVRFEWTLGDGRKGYWIELLPPDKLSDEDRIDPRAAFCGDDVTEVWTQKRRDDNSVVKVKRVDRERYQLLVEKLPPPDSELHLPLDIRNLQLQGRALRQLSEAPLPHHRGLLRLCENPERVRWPEVCPREPERWFSLTDPERSGTEEQRRFVRIALATPDLALLEGPPGSGKTTAICELIQQLVTRGKRVLLCASTHVAIDNVLERLLKDDAPVAVDALRIGNEEKVDRKVRDCVLDLRVDALVEQWRSLAAFQGLGDGTLREMAERTLIMGADLTCGTTMGIIRHPLFRDRDSGTPPWERPISTLPHWDVLIVDEASKTTVQEFLVPALMARQHVVVGDVRQLPPFTERADIMANLGSLVDSNDREVFPQEHQRARLLLWRLGRRQLQQPGVRWLVVEPNAVLDAMERELAHGEWKELSVARVVARPGRAPGPVRALTPRELRSGSGDALWLAAADLVLVSSDLLHEVAPYLPSTLLCTEDLTPRERALPASHPFLFRAEHWRARRTPLRSPVRERGDELTTLPELEDHERDWLSRHDWAGEMTWRLTRVHELKHSQNTRERERLERDIQALRPRAADIQSSIEEIQDIGLPSILEVIQEGIGEERSKRVSALTQGLPHRQRKAFEERFGSLTWQHRMHPDISALPRELFYKRASLKDANTLPLRDAEVAWDFAPELRGRRAWLHVHGHEQHGVNQDEVDQMEHLLSSFMSWARRKGPPRRRSGPAHWEVACLSFYVKQEGAIRTMLRKLTGDDDGQTRFHPRGGGIEFVCATVDRFQGREADLVLLSLRNTGRTGFLDSPNRLNVAVTRARQQLVVVGNADYFEQRCGVPELEELARVTPRLTPHRLRGRQTP